MDREAAFAPLGGRAHQIFAAGVEQLVEPHLLGLEQLVEPLGQRGLQANPVAMTGQVVQMSKQEVHSRQSIGAVAAANHALWAIFPALSGRGALRR